MCEEFTRTYISLLTAGREDEAYRMLYEEYHQLLLRFATAFLKSREPAEELVNDLLYKIWLKKDGIAEISNLRIYLLASIRNMCLTILSKQRKEQEMKQRMSSSVVDLCTSDPESLYISNELQTLIREVIEKLPPRCKQIYQMVRVERLRNKDVAVKLNISVNTIDVQLAIALKRLVQAVNAYNQKTGFSKMGAQ